jgi:hypothetical protein
MYSFYMVSDINQFVFKKGGIIRKKKKKKKGKEKGGISSKS